ncbi:MAG: DUF2282 domain-containing protein [Gammaproteobacteria bacterium]|nr:DUF2282 domain-containing protein [Gammaproteobacteria bacterium]
MSEKRTPSLLVAGAVAAAFALSAAPAFAGDDDAAEDMSVKCYGIAAAGENDCASANGNSCAGTSTVDNDPLAWKVAESAEACEAAGGSLVAGDGEEDDAESA